MGACTCGAAELLVSLRAHIQNNDALLSLVADRIMHNGDCAIHAGCTCGATQKPRPPGARPIHTSLCALVQQAMRKE